MKEGYDYAKRSQAVYYEDDQPVFVPPPRPTCSSWKCQEWEGDVPIAPLLVIFRRDNYAVRKCPKCSSEYGIITPSRIDEKTNAPVYDPL